MSDEHEPDLRAESLHAIAYCERLFYLQEVERITVDHDRVYAGRTLHAAIADDEAVAERRTFEIESEALGLRGKLDAVRHRDGGWVPVEHKRGRCRDLPDGSPGAWPSDAVQVAAYGMLLEEALDVTITEGRVRYHADNATVRVPLDAGARASVDAALERARELRATTERPPVAANERLCTHCSLAPVCLPEEERFADDPHHRPVRLFPPEPRGQVLHVTTPGARIGRSGRTLVVKADGKELGREPINDVNSVILHGHAQITTQALHLCAAEEVPVHWITGGGRYIGGLALTAGPVQRRIRQHAAIADPDRCLDFTRRLAVARVESQIRYLLRSTRGSRSPETKSALDEMRRACRRIGKADSRDVIRGHEGSAGRLYFSRLSELIRPGVPDALRPDGRSRRPPTDRFNAVLSFGYALLYSRVLQAILAVGLEPALGFFHTPRSAAHPLVLDLMELFRVAVWDIPLIGSINRRQWHPEDDFQVTRTKVWLSPDGRRKAIELFERRLEEQWRHPVMDYSLSWARAIELEVRLLEKEWTGSQGLFARVRLR